MNRRDLSRATLAGIALAAISFPTYRSFWSPVVKSHTWNGWSIIWRFGRIALRWMNAFALIPCQVR